MGDCFEYRRDYIAASWSLNLRACRTAPCEGDTGISRRAGGTLEVGARGAAQTVVVGLARLGTTPLCIQPVSSGDTGTVREDSAAQASRVAYSPFFQPVGVRVRWHHGLEGLARAPSRCGGHRVQSETLRVEGT